jgi:hypothetical protein
MTRRRFLGGAAVAIALPPLESLLLRPAHAAAEPRRLLTLFVPIGMLMNEWAPAQIGPLQVSGPTAPLEPIKNKVLILSHLANLSGKNRPGDHAAGTGAVFTCTKVAKGDGPAVRAGISLDQVAARTLGPLTPIPSLQLGVIPGRRTGVCEAGYSCVMENTISWADERTPLPPVQNAAAVFDRMFQGYDPGLSEAARAARRARRQGLLDYVRDETRALLPRLGRSDAVKLDQLLTGIADLDRQLRAAPAATASCGSLARPGDALDPNANAKVMNQLAVIAFQCDLTRVISNQIAPSYPNISYAHMGVPGGHHSISHFHDSNDHDLYRKIQLWHMQVVADLLQRLDAVREGSGTLLDHTMVVQASDVGSPDSHDHAHLPVMVAGGGGVFRMGRHLSFPGQTPIANLYLSVLNALGVAATSFGADGTGPLPGLTG